MKTICLILALCVYTQSFGYFALSATSHTECHEKESPEKKKNNFCCSSKHQHLESTSELNTEKNCHTHSEKDSRCSNDCHEEDSKGCCGSEDCDCHCCFHFQGLQVLYFVLNKTQQLPSVAYDKSKYSFTDALEKDRHSNIFHPPQFI